MKFRKFAKFVLICVCVEVYDNVAIIT